MCIIIPHCVCLNTLKSIIVHRFTTCVWLSKIKAIIFVNYISTCISRMLSQAECFHIKHR